METGEPPTPDKLPLPLEASGRSRLWRSLRWLNQATASTGWRFDDRRLRERLARREDSTGTAR